jgi:hypothetical protein
MLNELDSSNPVILAGDLNCWVDKTNNGSKAVIIFLEEEGLTMINNLRIAIYICHSRTSATDIAFCNSCLV